MREILFRGNRVDDGEWVQGYYVKQYGANQIYLPDGTDREYGFDYYHIDPSTIGQYTGLIDKNGKKIFEGDILKFSYNEEDENPTFYSVEWKSDRACFGYAETSDKMLEVDALHCEVIGNIHDNPELLESEVEGE